MIVQVLDFAMTASPSANYVLNVTFTAFLYAFLPVKLISVVLDRFLK